MHWKLIIFHLKFSYTLNGMIIQLFRLNIFHVEKMRWRRIQDMVLIERNSTRIHEFQLIFGNAMDKNTKDDSHGDNLKDKSETIHILSNRKMYECIHELHK
jgi:hypothetical protein